MDLVPNVLARLAHMKVNLGGSPRQPHICYRNSHPIDKSALRALPTGNVWIFLSPQSW
jgi:hypothetical protein